MTTSPSSPPSRPAAFPSGFQWGVATSSHQIEGDRPRRGDNVWDVFSRIPGAVEDGHHADVACDHLNLVADDVALMADLGIHAYRFSFAWPRVLPDGTGDLSGAGLAQYDRLVELLLTHGIEPVPTLFHWDLPLALEAQGGFRVRDCAYWFADYAALMAEHFGDRIRRWATHNEPWCFSYLGHASGEHAPGHTDPAAAVAVAHHLLLGHGLALQAMRAERSRLELGIVVNLSQVHVDEATDPDIARRVDGTLNRWFLDPVIHARYPSDVVDDLGHWLSVVQDGDEDVIGQRLDWLGVNYYNDHFYTAADGQDADRQAGRPTPHVSAGDIRPFVPDTPTTGIGWPITPSGFEQLLVRLRRDYGDALPPLWITENGAAYDDPVVDGRCHDERRVHYYDAHLRAVLAAIEAGVDIRGYFAWSLLDNFEWAYGYNQRFGLVHVDYETLARTPRTSAYWYAERCRTNALPPHGHVPGIG